jgi:hypothetical protein
MVATWRFVAPSVSRADVDAPQWDPAYHALAAVETRDLAIYEALSTIGGRQ